MRKRKWSAAGVVLLVLLSGIYLLVGFARAAAPAPADRSGWLTGTLIAHRGIHNNDGGIYENTRPAFEKAIAAGNPIELDVQLTRDKKVVVYHDKKLKRLLGMDANLNETNYGDLAKLRFPNSNDGVPLFEEVLGLVNGRVPLLIEIKNEDEVGDLEGRVYDALSGYRGAYAIQSFNPYSVAWFKDNAPDVLRGQLSGSFEVSDYEVEYCGTTRLPGYKRFLLSSLLLNFESRPNFIAYEINNVDVAKLENLKKLGVPLLGWTVRSAEDYRKTRHIFDNFIVERFDVK